MCWTRHAGKYKTRQYDGICNKNCAIKEKAQILALACDVGASNPLACLREFLARTFFCDEEVDAEEVVV